MHLKSITINTEKFPTREYYPFSLDIIQKTGTIEFASPVTFFAGENGTGKSTILKAVCSRCGIYQWHGIQRTKYRSNPYENKLSSAVDIEWNERVPGSFFGSDTFSNFSAILDEWAATDPGVLEYFGGSSLRELSHGQSIMAFFRSRYTRKGIYFLDEPETALSPKTQLGLLEILEEAAESGIAQFIIASHSPILTSCRNADIISFDFIPPERVKYTDTAHFKVFRDFFRKQKTED